MALVRSGVMLSPPGIYTVIPLTGYTTDHIQMNCVIYRTSQFTVDFTGSTLMFSVRGRLQTACLSHPLMFAMWLPMFAWWR